MTRTQIAMGSLAGVIAVVATVMVARVEAQRAKNLIIVDGGGRDARIEIDGTAVGNVAKGTHVAFDIKKGKHVIRAVHPDGSAEETRVDVATKYYRALYRLEGAKPVALVSVAYGHCSTYYNKGHQVVWNGKGIDQPGMIMLPAEPPLLELPKAIYVDSFDQPFAKTFPVERSECGYLSTHVCHVGDDGEPACADALGEHEAKPAS